MSSKVRGFELISSETDTQLIPHRATHHAAGYDLKASKDIYIKPEQIALVPTGIKAYMLDDEVLYLYDRSSSAKKLGVVLINSVGVIDSDYYNNDSNEGQIYVQFKNISTSTVHIERGMRIAQAVFQKYLLADNVSEETKNRSGGFGSTD